MFKYKFIGSLNCGVLVIFPQCLHVGKSLILRVQCVCLLLRPFQKGNIHLLILKYDFKCP